MLRSPNERIVQWSIPVATHSNAGANFELHAESTFNYLLRTLLGQLPSRVIESITPPVSNRWCGNPD
jgi:hypothetical protein